MSGVQENVSSVPDNTAPVSVDPHPSGEQPVEVEATDESNDEGEVIVENTEETKPTKRRGSTKGSIRKVTAEEHNYLVTFADTCLTDTDPWDKAVGFAELPAELQNFTEMNKLIARGLVTATVENGTIVAVALTEVGFEFANKGEDEATKVTKAPKTPGKARGNPNLGESRMKYNDPNYRIKKMVEGNPRREGSHGYYAWELLKDGMTYREYLDAEYNEDQTILGTDTKFTGPASNHFNWDLNKGLIAIYDATKSEDDPGYWVVRHPIEERKSPGKQKPDETATTEAASTGEETSKKTKTPRKRKTKGATEVAPETPVEVPEDNAPSPGQEEGVEVVTGVHLPGDVNKTA